MKMANIKARIFQNSDGWWLRHDKHYFKIDWTHPVIHPHEGDVVLCNRWGGWLHGEDYKSLMLYAYPEGEVFLATAHSNYAEPSYEVKK